MSAARTREQNLALIAHHANLGPHVRQAALAEALDGLGLDALTDSAIAVMADVYEDEAETDARNWRLRHERAGRAHA